MESPAFHSKRVESEAHGRAACKRYALIVVLGYSRLLWVQFYARQTMKALMHGLESSFS